jgi:hypothetical protein
MNSTQTKFRASVAYIHGVLKSFRIMYESPNWLHNLLLVHLAAHIFYTVSFRMGTE